MKDKERQVLHHHEVLTTHRRRVPRRFVDFLLLQSVGLAENGAFGVSVPHEQTSEYMGRFRVVCSPRMADVSIPFGVLALDALYECRRSCGCTELRSCRRDGYWSGPLSSVYALLHHRVRCCAFHGISSKNAFLRSGMHFVFCRRDDTRSKKAPFFYYFYAPLLSVSIFKKIAFTLLMTPSMDQFDFTK